MVRFVAINDYGNRFFMDNININGQNILTVEEVDSLSGPIIGRPKSATFRTCDLYTGRSKEFPLPRYIETLFK